MMRALLNDTCLVLQVNRQRGISDFSMSSPNDREPRMFPPLVDLFPFRREDFQAKAAPLVISLNYDRRTTTRSKKYDGSPILIKLFLLAWYLPMLHQAI
jgi:hypothetical protein